MNDQDMPNERVYAIRRVSFVQVKIKVKVRLGLGLGLGDLGLGLR